MELRNWTFSSYIGLTATATVSVNLNAINIYKWRTVDVSVKIKVQDFLHVFDMIFFFNPKKLETTSWWDLTIEKNPWHIYQLKAFRTTYTFYRLLIIRCFHLFIESLHCKIPVMFVKWKKRQQRKRLQNRPIRPFCFFVKFNACVVFMDTRVF